MLQRHVWPTVWTRAVIRRGRGWGHEWRVGAGHCHGVINHGCVRRICRHGPNRLMGRAPDIPATAGVSARRWYCLWRFFTCGRSFRLGFRFGLSFALLPYFGASVLKPHLLWNYNKQTYSFESWNGACKQVEFALLSSVVFILYLMAVNMHWVAIASWKDKTVKNNNKISIRSFRYKS